MLQHTVIEHPIPPTWNNESEILILGSFPSVKSRETGYFYGHPQNRFWRVMAALYGEEVPEGKEERRAFLLRNGVAAWDVIASCTIVGSSDSSIRPVRRRGTASARQTSRRRKTARLRSRPRRSRLSSCTTTGRFRQIPRRCAAFSLRARSPRTRCRFSATTAERRLIP